MAIRAGTVSWRRIVAVRRGTFTSVKQLISSIENFIDGWNDRCTPFIWTKTADDILTKAP